MKLTLDEWIVREVIDTLYMARTTLLGITGLDSPQDVEKKSANETAITRRISKAIDIIQQSEQPHISDSLEEAAEEYAYTNWEDNDYHEGASEGLPFDAIGHTGKCFKAGAEWQRQQGIVWSEKDEEKKAYDKGFKAAEEFYCGRII